MNMQITENDNEIIIAFTVDLVSSHIGDIENEVNRVLKDNTRDVIFNMKDVSKIDSMSLAAIIRIKNKLSDKGRNLLLTNTGEGVMRIIDLAGLNDYLLE